MSCGFWTNSTLLTVPIGGSSRSWCVGKATAVWRSVSSLGWEVSAGPNRTGFRRGGGGPSRPGILSSGGRFCFLPEPIILDFCRSPKSLAPVRCGFPCIVITAVADVGVFVGRRKFGAIEAEVQLAPSGLLPHGFQAKMRQAIAKLRTVRGGVRWCPPAAAPCEFATGVPPTQRG